VAARLLRAPVWLYRARLGRLLGSRFLMVTHTGRVSGRTRRTVLEVVDHDPASGEWFVMAGWGPRSDWLRNLRADPVCRVDVAGHGFAARAREVGRAEREQLLTAYRRRHPRAWRALGPRVLGRPLDGGPESVRALAAALPAVGLRPAQAPAT
jgi:deazaflavin-dependent oxidoreductase (nitroreductase family)